MTPKKTLKKWFSNLMKPAQEHFAAWIDSYWHKSEQIPMSNIEGLSRAIENTVSAKQLLNHLEDTNAHSALFDELKRQIQAIQTILQVDDVNLDTLQEIVTELKANTKLQELIDKKVNKEDGKGLSSNDFTNELKQKLDGLQPNEVSSKLKSLEKILTIYEDGGVIGGIAFEDENNHNIAIVTSSSDFSSTFDRFDIASAVHTKIGGGDVIIGSMNTEDSADYSEIMLRRGQLMLKYKNIKFNCPEENRLVTNGELKALENRIAALEAKEQH